MGNGLKCESLIREVAGGVDLINCLGRGTDLPLAQPQNWVKTAFKKKKKLNYRYFVGPLNVPFRGCLTCSPLIVGQIFLLVSLSKAHTLVHFQLVSVKV